jgi:hypothetical protein
MPAAPSIAGLSTYGYPLGLQFGVPPQISDGLFLSAANAGVGNESVGFPEVFNVPTGLLATHNVSANNMAVAGVVSPYNVTQIPNGLGVPGFGEMVIQVRGVARVRVTGTVNAGDVLTTSATSGAAATNNGLTAATVNAALAIALEPSSAADTAGTIRCRLVV